MQGASWSAGRGAVQGATRSPGAMLLTFSDDPQRPRGHPRVERLHRRRGAAAASTAGGRRLLSLSRTRFRLGGSLQGARSLSEEAAATLARILRVRLHDNRDLLARSAICLVGTSRSISSSDTWARAGVRLVSSGGVALRHAREGDEQDIWGRARVEHVIHFAWSLDERLPRTVGRGLALAANR